MKRSLEERRRGYAPINTERDATIADLYEGGLNMREIGDRYGICRERVRQVLKRLGVASRGPRGERKERVLVPCAVCGKVTRRLPHEKHKRACGNVCGGKLYRKWTPENLRSHLSRLAQKLGKTPGINDINVHGPPDHMAYVRNFGSIREAQIAAGLTPNRRGGFNRWLKR